MRIKMRELTNPVLLMPFTAKAVLLYHALHHNGKLVLSFFDNDNEIDGMRYEDCEIINPKTMSETKRDALVILCEYRHYEANELQLIHLGFHHFCKIEDMLSFEEARCFISQINANLFHRIVPRQSDALKQLPLAINTCFLPEALNQDDALILDILDVIVTEKCSLRCKNCANLMQYFTNPQNMSLEQVYRDIDLIFSKTDWIRNLYIFGGEAFLYKQLSQVLKYANQYKKYFGLLRTITNGTFVPSEDTLQAMKDSEMFVSISNYGQYSFNIEKLTEELEKYHIPYQCFNAKWFNYQQLVEGEGRDVQKIFSDCKESCATLRNGLLYRCPFLTHAETLRAIPYNEYNHIDISHDEIKKSDIKNYLAPPANHSHPIPPGCAYCSGYDVGNMLEIPVAEQAAAPLPYKFF